jgi:hypothetical protein
MSEASRRATHGHVHGNAKEGGRGGHLALGEVTTADARARVNRRGLFKDEVGLDQLADSLTCERASEFWRGKTASYDIEGRRWVAARELVMEMSLISLGSNQTFFLPQPRTAAARRFCNLRDTILFY